HAEAHRDLNRRVELRRVGLLGQPYRLERGVEPAAVDQLGRLAVSLTALHLVLLWYRSGHLGRLATRVALPPILRSRRTTRPRRDLPLSVLDGDPHRPGGAGDDLLRRLNVIGVEVGHLPLRDLT